MVRLLYTLVGFLLLPWALLHLLWRARRQPEYLRHWRERFAFYGERNGAAVPTPLLWIHAVSVGETRAAQPLIALLRQRYPGLSVLLTHTTPTGRAASAELFGSGVLRVYLPYDTPGAVRRFLAHFRPSLGVIMETEIWPNLIFACKQHRLPLLLVNARLSPRSARRYARLPALTRPALAGFAAVAAQDQETAQRLIELGAASASTTVTGNLKFDSTPAPELAARGRAWRRQWNEATPRQVLLAASTREGEEESMLAALIRHPVANRLIVIVPRHPQRFAAVAALAAGMGWRVQRRSELGPEPRVAGDTEVLIGDSMGEMAAYYAAADVAVMGGSLKDYGSQNLIEACAAGVPVLLGPSTYNFAWAAEAALACGAARQFGDADAIAAAAAALLGDAAARNAMGEAGAAFAAKHRGASERTLALLGKYLS